MMAPENHKPLRVPPLRGSTCTRLVCLPVKETQPMLNKQFEKIRSSAEDEQNEKTVKGVQNISWAENDGITTTRLRTFRL